jgi:hypothetical protein
VANSNAGLLVTSGEVARNEAKAGKGGVGGEAVGTSGGAGGNGGNSAGGAIAPEPSALVLSSVGGVLAGLGYWWRRRKPAAA